MLKKIIHINLIIIFHNILFAQSVSKLLESIQNYDYYHTKKYAYKMLKSRKKLSAGAYALSYVYYQNFQPFHNLDSADKYIHLAIINYPHRPYVTKFGNIDSTKIYQLYDSISFYQFKKIQHNIFPKIYDVFLSHHPFVSKELKELIKTHQYQKIIEYVQTINKSDTTFYYITQYHSHPQLNILKQILDKQIFQELTKHHTAAEYLLFLRNYPQNSFKDVALQSLLSIYINEKNTAGLKNFIKEFSQEKYYTEQAWKWLFTFSVKKFNNEELEKFIQEYPEFPFKKEILQEMEMNTQILIPLADTTGLIGFIDTSGQYKILPVYDAVTPFKENISVVFKNDSAYLINKSGQKLIARGFKDAYPFYNGYAPVFDGNRWYFINRLGFKQSDDFEWISELSNDFNYIFKKENKYGLCDYKGQIILPVTFEKLGDFENHRAYYIENNLYGIVLDNGNKYPAKYQWISTFSNDYAIVKQNNLYGIININDEIILNPEYDLIFHCTNDIYLIVKNKKYGYFNASEKCFIYSIQWDYNNNLNSKLMTNGQYFKLINQNKTFIGNQNGIILNKKQFQDVLINNDFVIAKNKNKWGIVNTNNINNPNIFQYTNAYICNNQTLIVQNQKEYLIIDNKGNILYKSENKITHISNKYYLVESDDDSRLIDIKGNVIISSVDNYEIFQNFLIVVKADKSIKVIHLR